MESLRHKDSGKTGTKLISGEDWKVRQRVLNHEVWSYGFRLKGYP